MVLQPGSGCGRIHKEDVTDCIYLMQAKSTKGDKVTVHLNDLKKLIKHASKANKNPAFAIGFFVRTILSDDRMWIMMPIDQWIRHRKQVPVPMFPGRS